MIITYNIVYCVCDEEFDSFCCRFTTMSRVIEHDGCRIASPAWQTKSPGARRQHSQATVNNVLPLMTDSPSFLTRPPNIAHSAWMHGILWNAIFTSSIAKEIDVIDTLRFNNDVDFLYRLATVLEMGLNHEYRCELEFFRLHIRALPYVAIAHGGENNGWVLICSLQNGIFLLGDSREVTHRITSKICDDKEDAFIYIM